MALNEKTRTVRVELIRKELAGIITKEEREQLDTMEAEILESIHEMIPLPDDRNVEFVLSFHKRQITNTQKVLASHGCECSGNLPDRVIEALNYYKACGYYEVQANIARAEKELYDAELEIPRYIEGESLAAKIRAMKSYTEALEKELGVSE